VYKIQWIKMHGETVKLPTNFVTPLMWQANCLSHLHKKQDGIFSIMCLGKRRTIKWQACKILLYVQCVNCRSQWTRGLSRGSAAAHLLGLWVRIPPGAWMYVRCECCELSGRSLCDGLITHPEEFYWVCWVRVWSRSPERKVHDPE